MCAWERDRQRQREDWTVSGFPVSTSSIYLEFSLDSRLQVHPCDLDIPPLASIHPQFCHKTFCIALYLLMLIPVFPEWGQGIKPYAFLSSVEKYSLDKISVHKYCWRKEKTLSYNSYKSQTGEWQIFVLPRCQGTSVLVFFSNSLLSFLGFLCSFNLISQIS
jgi:hypothetical protein